MIAHTPGGELLVLLLPRWHHAGAKVVAVDLAGVHATVFVTQRVTVEHIHVLPSSSRRVLPRRVGHVHSQRSGRLRHHKRGTDNPSCTKRRLLSGRERHEMLLSCRLSCRRLLKAPRGRQYASTAAAPAKLKYFSAWFCPFAHRATLALEHHGAAAVPYEWEESLGWEQRPPSGEENFVAEERSDWWYHWKSPALLEANPLGSEAL